MGRRITLPGVEVEKGAGFEPVTLKKLLQNAPVMLQHMRRYAQLPRRGDLPLA
jgi:hypothetical protein